MLHIQRTDQDLLVSQGQGEQNCLEFNRSNTGNILVGIDTAPMSGNTRLLRQARIDATDGIDELLEHILDFVGDSRNAESGQIQTSSSEANTRNIIVLVSVNLVPAVSPTMASLWVSPRELAINDGVAIPDQMDVLLHVRQTNSSIAITGHATDKLVIAPHLLAELTRWLQVGLKELADAPV